MESLESWEEFGVSKHTLCGEKIQFLTTQSQMMLSSSSKECSARLARSDLQPDA